MKALKTLADLFVALAYGLLAAALAFHDGARHCRRLQREGLAYQDRETLPGAPRAGQ